MSNIEKMKEKHEKIFILSISGTMIGTVVSFTVSALLLHVLSLHFSLLITAPLVLSVDAVLASCIIAADHKLYNEMNNIQKTIYDLESKENQKSGEIELEKNLVKELIDKGLINSDVKKETKINNDERISDDIASLIVLKEELINNSSEEEKSIQKVYR